MDGGVIVFILLCLKSIIGLNSWKNCRPNIASYGELNMTAWRGTVIEVDNVGMVKGTVTEVYNCCGAMEPSPQRTENGRSSLCCSSLFLCTIFSFINIKAPEQPVSSKTFMGKLFMNMLIRSCL